MNFYSRLTSDQVGAACSIINMLRRLKIIGNLRFHTMSHGITYSSVEKPIYDFSYSGYSLVKDGYSDERLSEDDMLILERLLVTI